jgi:hypothetical protein
LVHFFFYRFDIRSSAFENGVYAGHFHQREFYQQSLVFAAFVIDVAVVGNAKPRE